MSGMSQEMRRDPAAMLRWEGLFRKDKPLREHRSGADSVTGSSHEMALIHRNRRPITLAHDPKHRQAKEDQGGANQGSFEVSGVAPNQNSRCAENKYAQAELDIPTRDKGVGDRGACGDRENRGG